MNAGESICLHKKGKDFNVASIEAYIDIFLLADCEDESEYLANISYGEYGFVAIKKLSDHLFLYMACNYNIFSYVDLYLKNLGILAVRAVIKDEMFKPILQENKVNNPKNGHLEAAKQIQSLVLLNDLILNNFFSNHFLMYEPQDVIGGDFYSFYDFDDVVFVIVADCTGHSVEGALATMAVSAIIKQIITKSSLQTSDIIEQIFSKIDDYNESQNGSKGYGLGVELGVCKYNKTTRASSFSSNEIHLIHQTEDGPNLIKAKKRLFGRVFHHQKVQLSECDSLVMFSDGIPDQFDKEDKHKLGKVGVQKILGECFKNGRPCEKEFKFVERRNSSTR